MILIISRDGDFSSVVAEQIKLELKADCLVIPAVEDARRLTPEGLSLIVTNENIKENMSVPVVAVEEGEKPVRMRQLLERISAHLQSPADDLLAFGPYRFSLRQKQLVHQPSGKLLSLTDKEAQLLFELVRSGKKGIAKDALLKRVWGVGEAVDTHTLETHIYRLRGKFRELADEDAITATDGGYALGTKQP